ncbi:MAG: sigma 54-interacting transcriptional regulator [Myxococcales bacterium]|nr:sigma 54-interacting transcriptional regulator [Myxococcales bacterium]
MSERVSSKLATGELPYFLEAPLGEGARAKVWAARDADGRQLAIKVSARASDHELWLEAERLLFASSRVLPGLVDVGRVPRGVPQLSDRVGHTWLALERAPGRAIDPATLGASERTAIALVVARDVAEALDDLHQSGLAHGDVKPANIVLSRSTARLVDLGLSAASDEVVPRGATLRYLPPEVRSTGTLGDARARDLFALGVTLAEIASAELARAKEPARQPGVDLPAPIAAIVGALLASAPGARPAAAWVRKCALRALGQEDPPDDRTLRRRRAVERAYLAVRRREIVACATARTVQIDVAGAPAEWLGRAIALTRRLANLRGAEADGAPVRVGNLDAFGRARLLVRWVGPLASRWPTLSAGTDRELVDRALALCSVADPEAFTFGAFETGASSGATPPKGAIEIALALGRGGTDAQLLDAAERVLHEAPHPALGVALGHALCLRGELGRALSVLRQTGTPEARVEAAEVARRSGDLETASELALGGLDGAADRARPVLARLALDRGDLVECRARLDEAGEGAAAIEVRALLALAEGRRADALELVAQGLSIAVGAEERARLEATRGGVHHAAGEAEAALGSFRRATELATRSAAVLEEATYSTGLAAAATDLGRLAEALDAARRAVLLFEFLGRPRDAARAALARTAAFAAAGAVAETLDAAQDALSRARSADDSRCAAYVHLALADVLPLSSLDGAEHADRALALISDPDDRLRAEARRLVRGRDVDVVAMDAASRRAEAAVDARVEWWGARAWQESRSANPTRADALLVELAGLAPSRVPTSVRGPAFAAAARLAARLGDGERARRFSAVAKAAAAELCEHAPPELGQAVRALPWLSQIAVPADSGVSSDQVADVESLVHALGRRDRLRPLLEQVLDALITWTGVERGLLLLRAPGGKLVPRAARNLERHDLTDDQLALSNTLAERALALSEPVVAVDAAGELPELHQSVHALKLRSVLAVPLLAHGEALGVVYLDDRMRRGAFGPAELAWVRLLGSLAAVAIADARDRVLLRRAARRARRAEARLAQDLAAREALLDVAEHELARARARDTRFTYSQIVGESDVLRSLLRTLDRVSLSDVPVLIAGESGSGKELVARAIHEHSARCRQRFVSENCGAIPEPLLESTLFGHVRGAFTGASRARAGLFEVADGGTLFLDEIAEMSLGMQTKLLRVLEDGEVHALGSERSRRVDVRVIGATHRDLEARVAAGLFRQDLLYRLNVIRLEVPSLRQRRGDIPLLVRHFLAKHAGGRSVRISREAVERLAAFPWPGNIRQLENEIRRALVLADELIDVAHLSPEVAAGAGRVRSENELDLRARVDELEQALVEKALAQTSGNQTRAAELLGLSRFGLQKMMKRLGVGQPPKPGRRTPAGLVRSR